MRLSKGQWAFFTAWLGLVLLAVVAIQWHERYQLGRGEAIASLTKSRGVVQYRGQDVPIWSYVATDQHFYENDVVATGADGKAEIQFLSGRGLILAPNTQILLTTRQIDGNSDAINVVQLLKGELEAPKSQRKNAAAPKIVLKVDDKEVVPADLTTSVRISKTSESPAVVSVAEGKAEVIERKEVAKLEVPEGRPFAIAPPTNSPAPLLEPLAAGPKLLRPESGSRLWTLLPWARQKLPTLTLSISAATSDEVPTRGTPSVRFEDEAEPIDVQDGAGEPERSVRVPASTLWTQAKKTTQGGLDLRSINVWTGYRADSGERLFAQSPQVIYMGSLTEQAHRPVAVRLGRLAARKPKQAWYPEAPSLEARDAAATIVVPSGAMLSRLSTLIAGAERFTVARRAALPKNGAMVIRGGDLIAVAFLGASTPGNWELIRSALDADFIYRGSRSDLIAGRARGADGDLALPRSSHGKTVYVLTGSNVVGIESRLLNESPAARRLVEDSATALFTKPVEVVASRRPSNAGPSR